jgi:hypothetical protein
MITFPTFGTALLLACSLLAHADEQGDGMPQTLEFNTNGDAKVNGADFKAGAQERPADVYADVVKVVQDPSGESTLFLRPIEARKLHADGSVEKIPVSADPRPFTPQADWKMFDAEGEVTKDPRFALRVIMPYPTDESSNKSIDVIWNECQGPISGNYVGVSCARTRGLADEYMAYLNQHFLPCVNQSLGSVGLSPATAVHIQHDGTTADAQHNSGSLHQVGRAIDIQIVTTTDAQGQKNSFDFRQTNTDHVLSHSCKPAGTKLCKFYETFRACWGKLQVDRHCPARHDGPIGTMGWEDARHIAHHLHTSYPFCPNNNGYFITDDYKK